MSRGRMLEHNKRISANLFYDVTDLGMTLRIFYFGFVSFFWYFYKETPVIIQLFIFFLCMLLEIESITIYIFLNLGICNEYETMLSKKNILLKEIPNLN